MNMSTLDIMDFWRPAELVRYIEKFIGKIRHLEVGTQKEVCYFENRDEFSNRSQFSTFTKRANCTMD